MKMPQVIFQVLVLILLVLPGVCMGNTNRRIPQDTVEITTFRDTTYSPQIPPIEIRMGTYHNFFGSTSVGYKLILRGAELDINGALLYKEDPEAHHTHPLRLLSPFHIHVGDSADHRRIDHVYVKHKFPFSSHFSEDDSLVIITSKGNYTLYLSEDKRSAAKYTPMLDSLHKELSDTERNLNDTRTKSRFIIAVIIFIALAGGVVALLYFRRIKRLQADQMNKLLVLISENEMNSRQLKAKVSDLMRNNFKTINQLCYEYFEKADTAFLKKSIYVKVEQEIDRLKSPQQLVELENTLNTYCDGIISRITEQIPQLTQVERTLLIYLYSGLSARTICILMNIQLKNFYMRRLRLKNKIQSSDAPSRDWFVSLM